MDSLTGLEIHDQSHSFRRHIQPPPEYRWAERREHDERRFSNIVSTEPSARRLDQISIDTEFLQAFTEPEALEKLETYDVPTIAVQSNSTALSPRVPRATDEKHSNERQSSIVEKQSIPAPYYPKEPARFSFFPSNGESNLHAAEFGGLVSQNGGMQSLLSSSAKHGLGAWWLNIQDPTREEVEAICQSFGIHNSTSQAIIAREKCEKTEHFASYYLVCLTSLRSVEESDGFAYTPFNLYLIVFSEGIISISFGPNTHVACVRSRTSSIKDSASPSSDSICYALIYESTESFSPAVCQVEREADVIEDEVLLARHDDSQAYLSRICRVRKKAMLLTRLLDGRTDMTRDLANRYAGSDRPVSRSDTTISLDYIRDRVRAMTKSLGHFEEMLSRSYSIYLDQISVNNMIQGNRTNECLSRVTVVATILVPLNVVCGLFGMNVKVPWADQDNLHAWLGIASGIVFLALALLVVARRMRYI